MSTSQAIQMDNKHLLATSGGWCWVQEHGLTLITSTLMTLIKSLSSLKYFRWLQHFHLMFIHTKLTLLQKLTGWSSRLLKLKRLYQTRLLLQQVLCCSLRSGIRYKYLSEAVLICVGIYLTWLNRGSQYYASLDI